MIALHPAKRCAYATEALTVSTMLSSTTSSQACLQDERLQMQGVKAPENKTNCKSMFGSETG